MQRNAQHLIILRLPGIIWHLHRQVGGILRRTTVHIKQTHLLQKVVVGLTGHPIRVGQKQRIANRMCRYGEIVIDTGDVVHILVPHRTGILPWCTTGFENMKMAVEGTGKRNRIDG